MSPGRKVGTMLEESTVIVEYSPRRGRTPSPTAAAAAARTSDHCSTCPRIDVSRDERRTGNLPARRWLPAVLKDAVIRAARCYLLVAARWVPVKAYVTVELLPWKVLSALAGSESVTSRWSVPVPLVRTFSPERLMFEPITGRDARTLPGVPLQL